MTTTTTTRSTRSSNSREKSHMLLTPLISPNDDQIDMTFVCATLIHLYTMCTMYVLSSVIWWWFFPIFGAAAFFFAPFSAVSYWSITSHIIKRLQLGLLLMLVGIVVAIIIGAATAPRFFHKPNLKKNKTTKKSRYANCVLDTNKLTKQMSGEKQVHVSSNHICTQHIHEMCSLRYHYPKSYAHKRKNKANVSVRCDHQRRWAEKKNSTKFPYGSCDY